MFYNMVLKLGLWTMTKSMKWNNAPALVATLMAMAMRWCNAAHITQWKIPRPARVAAGRCHRSTSCSVLPRRPPGLHAKHYDKKIHAPLWPFWWPRSFVAILMAITMCRYDTVGIAQWRRSRTLLELTGRHQQGSICSNSINLTCQPGFLIFFTV